MNYQHILETVWRDIQPYARLGQQADYIPALARVNPDQAGICLKTLDGRTCSVGDADVRFSIQSISKVFSLALALHFEGENLWTRMGREPSGTAFNSLVQLEYEHGIPRNPLINAGALVTADILLDHLPDNPELFYIDFLRTLCGSPDIGYNTEVAASEQSCGYMNAAIANLLKHYGNIHGDLDRVMRLYFMMCSVEMSCRELAQAFIPFANHRQPFSFAGIDLTTSQIKRMNAIMQTCGFYDEAGEFSYLVGLPGKSGVGGGIAAICPMRYTIAVWSPRLNAKGNSILGMKALELFTTLTAESIF
ncbi:MAG: glutaminase [Bacteroidaceae bacterium]|nr:glutaminase [Bacteroidaceae bacterium]